MALGFQEGIEGTTVVAFSLQEGMSSLDLTGVRLSVADLALLTSVLANNTELTSLNIAGCGVKDEGHAFLATLVHGPIYHGDNTTAHLKRSEEGCCGGVRLQLVETVL